MNQEEMKFTHEISGTSEDNEQLTNTNIIFGIIRCQIDLKFKCRHGCTKS